MIIFATILITCCISIWISYNWLIVSEFTVSDSKICNPFRVVLISDLHDHEFGRKNIRLVKRIKNTSPDLIILDGDMINKNSEDSHVAVDLIEQLKMTAPVCYSLGNHEYGYIEAGNTELLDELINAGAMVVNYGIYDVEINGNSVRLGGLYEYGFETSMQSEEDNGKAVKYLEKFTDTERYEIMCAHRPESLYCWDYVDKWGIDLQLSGHLHGGQVIIPFIGGLYCPMNGFFPEYDYGQYQIGDSTMIITRGLSSNPKILPRFNNPPEIAVIDIVPS